MMVKVNCEYGDDGHEDYDGVGDADGDAAHDDSDHGGGDDENA